MRDDNNYMHLVIDLARSTIPQTLPNPNVAAIIVNNGQLVGLGCHLRAGGPHAETYAIQQAGAYARNGTLYVNLEPCAHFGKTPPCVDAVIAAGITRVVIANLDPNPLVAGKGVAKLTAAGIDVDVGLMAEKGQEINEVFFHIIKHQQPFVTLKVGMSLDGKIATKNNQSQWITSIESRKDAHYYRATHNAILTGVNTVISDDPSLTPHLLEGNITSKPIRVILDHTLRTPLISKLINDGQAQTWILTVTKDSHLVDQFIQKGVRVIIMPDLEVDTILNTLYQNNVYSVMVEGGEQIYASFIEAQKVNQIVSYINPQLIGSRDARHFFAGNGFSNLQNNLHLTLFETRQLGNDIKIVAKNYPKT